MRLTQFDRLSAPAAPPGYGLRRYRPGDEDAWIALLATGNFGTWDRARLDRMLAGERAPLPRAGIFFATHQDQPVGAACTFLYDDQRQDAAELGWVVVHPGHRRRGLGLQVCQATLGFVRDLGYESAFLLTEDFRLPAIKLYLRLGFEPEMIDPSHPAWWAALRHSVSADDRSGP
jgi:mycothiol synthase